MPHSTIHLSRFRQRLRGLGCKPCHEDRLLRGWSQANSYDKANSPAEIFFPLALRNELPAIEAELEGLARLCSEHPAAGEAARLLIELHDGQMVESVLLPRGGLCVSTQVGCAVGCAFCMSGRDGLLRQLGSAEIVAQVVLARKRRKVSKVVFMGMGEPAHNLGNALEAIDVLGTYGNIAHKNLVLSTVGDVRVFERLMERCSSLTIAVRPEPVEGRESVHVSASPTRADLYSAGAGRRMIKPALAISLHTTDAALRKELLPRAPEIAIEELVERAETYARATGYPTQYQWTLLEGVNDSDAEVERVAQLLVGKYAIMNFIPFNEVAGPAFRRPTPEHALAMVHTLRRRGIRASLRDSVGQEVEGACGQLRARAAEMNLKTAVALSPSRSEASRMRLSLTPTP